MVFSEKLLEETLLRLTDLMSDCTDPWCVFGGAALYLHGYRDIPFSDIDVLISKADCERVRKAWDLPNEAGGGTDLFRSDFLLHPHLGPLDVEIMSNFEIFADMRWQPIDIGDPIETRLGSAIVPVASLEKIKSILRLSGRDKDLARLKLIDMPARSLATP